MGMAGRGFLGIPAAISGLVGFGVDLKDTPKPRMNKESTQANHRLVCLKHKAVAKEADICLLKCK